MLRRLLDLDPLVRLDGWLAMLRYGAGVRIVVPTSSIEPTLRTLRRFGVKTYAVEPAHSTPDERAFRVRTQQERWARYVMECAKAGKEPREWGVPARSVGFAGAVLRMFSRR